MEGIVNTENYDDKLKIEFLDLVNKNEADLSIAEKNKTYYEAKTVITLEDLGRNISLELAIIMMKCGYASWIFTKYDDIKKSKSEIMSVLENDRDIEEVALSMGVSYDELLSKIEVAKENDKTFTMFKFKDFYCEFAKRENMYLLNIFINKDNELIKVNEIFFNECDIEKAKKIIEGTMCKEIGYINDDGTYEKEHYGQGYIYKNYENFYRRKGVCYVSEHDGNTLEDGGISFDGICEEICDYLFLCGVDINKVPTNLIETMAKDVFMTVDWQYVTSLIQGDEYLSEYVEEFPEYYFRENYKQEKSKKYNYMMLDRLKSDCEYFLGNGNGFLGHLYYKDINKHIDEMKKLYNSFSNDEKPEWLSLEDIEEYKNKMIDILVKNEEEL